MLYPTMTGAQATAALAKLRENPDADIADEVTTSGEGEEVVDVSFAPTLAKRLIELAHTYGEDPSDQAGNRFEAQACEIVHRGIPPLPAIALADPGFWRWLAVSTFATSSSGATVLIGRTERTPTTTASGRLSVT